MKIATTNFSLQKTENPEDFWRRFRLMVQQAKGQEAELVLFPEYFSLSWLLAEGGVFGERLFAGADFEARFVEEVRRASVEFRIGIIAGTFPHFENKAEIRNRSWICLPDQAPFFQEKLHLTRGEAERWKISPGAPELRVFTHGGARCAVAICYDVEFPSYCAAAAEAKVDVLFVPSCTGDLHGYWRVRHCATARAVENQCYVVLSSVVEGDTRYPDDVGAHYGKAAVLSPCDTGFPEAGILAETKANVEEVIDARLELRALEELRRNGTVLNLADSRSPSRVTIRE
jgi:predicted amidohydrolase